MNHFPLENVDVPLVLLVGDAESLVLAQDHHRALHEVVHDVLEFGFPSFFVIYGIEFYVLILDNVEESTGLVARDETSALKRVILLPEIHFLILIVLLFEEQDLLGASSDQHGISEHDHVAQVKISYFLVSIF